MLLCLRSGVYCLSTFARIVDRHFDKVFQTPSLAFPVILISWRRSDHAKAGLSPWIWWRKFWIEGWCRALAVFEAVIYKGHKYECKVEKKTTASD